MVRADARRCAPEAASSFSSSWRRGALAVCLPKARALARALSPASALLLSSLHFFRSSCASFSRRLATGFAVLAALAVVLSACIGTTGSAIVSFDAYAAGTRVEPFVNAHRWTITLTRAKVHVGALYLNRAVPVSGGQERECFLPGVYVAQVTSGLDVDALSPEFQPFPTRGTGTEDFAPTAEVWLTGGRVDALEDTTVIADVAGTATRDGQTIRFEGIVTIGSNRAVPPTDPARPGAKPLCAERIVTPIPVAITPHDGGVLVLRIDPREWFANVELGELEPVTPGSDLRRFPDETVGQPATNLYAGLRAASRTYSFEFTSRVR